MGDVTIVTIPCSEKLKLEANVADDEHRGAPSPQAVARQASIRLNPVNLTITF